MDRRNETLLRPLFGTTVSSLAGKLDEARLMPAPGGTSPSDRSDSVSFSGFHLVVVCIAG